MYDLIVIGGGSGGIAAARETAKLGKRVLLIENAYLGGTCVNLGCVPKKITYNMTNIIEHMLLARSYGVYPSYEVDYGLFKECRDSAIRRLNIIYESMLGSNNVEVINGYARVIAAGKVEVNGRVHDGTHILLASGSKPKTLEIKGKEFVKYSDDFFYLKSIPKKTVIIGSGYISLEIAFMLALLGSEVSIILRGKRFLSHFDELFDSVVKEQLEKHRIRAYYEESVLEVCEEDRRSNNEQKETGEDNRGCQGTSTECGNGQNRTEQKENDVPPNEAYKNKIKQIKVVDVSKDRTNNKVRFGIHGEEINVKDKEDVLEIHKDEVRVEFEDERPRDSTYKVVLNNAVINNADFVMCAIGRDCDLSYVQVPINTHNSYAVVNEKFMTSVEGVYAVGDLIGPNHMLTPFAIFCARKLVRSLFEHEPIPADVYEFVPSVVFTHPPCASVGLSEQAAVARYGSVEVYETRFNNLIYALSDNKTSTVFKAIVHGGRVVGLHLFGNGVDEIVQGFAVGMKKGLSLDDLSNCVCVHPTAAEEVVTIGRVSPRRADK
ncbi:hypothetical protein VCUG_01676 [Vavraia culicis subsp. floridensis]|uniref:Uncharacterized protein n=1 Tax=Vavraia culicis (isolate floridensis) TaxID=948595 RepID=L2GU07_VAVCU|nr:uncharacterized protein VCUG_01676 [Vavraia culicis subsp. floridensis]ELA46832.1 hypothetical protein VCUG_01676 [Vavraia culicis subsp. floridensis]